MKLFKTLTFAQGILACRQIPDKLKRIEECPVKAGECGMLDGEYSGCPYGELCIPSSAPAMADFWKGKCVSCLPNIPNKARCIDLFYDKGKRVVDECMEKCHVPDLCAPEYDELDFLGYMTTKMNDVCGEYSFAVPNEGVYEMNEDGIMFKGRDERFLGDFVKFNEVFANPNLKNNFFTKNCENGRSTSGASVAAIIPGGGECLRGKINSRLHYKCGTSNKLIAVRHISSCQYYFYFEIVCSDIDEFMAKSAAENENTIDWQDYSLDELVQTIRSSEADEADEDNSSEVEDTNMYTDYYQTADDEDEDDTNDVTLVEMPDVQLKMGKKNKKN